MTTALVRYRIDQVGITRIEVRPVWDGAEFVPTPMAPLDLSYDHRVVNGADAARFLVRYRDLLKNPDDLLSDPPVKPE